MTRLKLLTNVSKRLLKNVIFADDYILITHTLARLQVLMDKFDKVCKMFGLTASIPKTRILVQSTDMILGIKVSVKILDAVHQFPNLGFTI